MVQNFPTYIEKMVQNFPTQIKNGKEFSHKKRNRISPLIQKTVQNFPTYMKKTVQNFPTNGISSIDETVKNFPTNRIINFIGGEILDRLWRRSTISPPVGKLLTIQINGQEFPHQWNPKFQRWGNFPTGGEIVDSPYEQSKISPPMES